MSRENHTEDLLEYLQTHLPEYPFDPDVDGDFVDELLHDFDHLDLLEELKAFRWYHNNNPAKRFKNLRLAIRRWLTYTWTHERLGA